MYGNRDKKWGEIYGYTLEPPMELETIENYERAYKTRLPEDFRNYLLHISSETIGSYPYKIELHEPFVIFIHDSNNTCPMFDPMIGDKFDEDNLGDVEKLHELKYYENYFIKTHENGCTDDLYICIKGPKYGKEGMFHGGGDFFGVE